MIHDIMICIIVIYLTIMTSIVWHNNVSNIPSTNKIQQEYNIRR